MISAHKCMNDWQRDDRGLRTIPKMKDVIEHRIWGLIFKVFLALAPIVVPALIYHANQNADLLKRQGEAIQRHAVQLENLVEWRRGHQDHTDDKERRIQALERSNQERSTDVAVLKDRLMAVTASSEKTSASISLMTEQMARLQQQTAAMNETLKSIQNKLDRP